MHNNKTILLIITISLFLISLLLWQTIIKSKNQEISKLLEERKELVGKNISYMLIDLMNSVDSDVESIWDIGNTDPKKIETFILEKEVYLDSGAIYYFRYKMKNE